MSLYGHILDRPGSGGGGTPAGELSWTEIVDETVSGTTRTGDGEALLEYSSDRWTATWGATGTNGDKSGASDQWKSDYSVPLEDIVPEHDWQTRGFLLGMELLTMTNDGNDTGVAAGLQLGATQPVGGYGFVDHNATNTRWVRLANTFAQTISSFATADIKGWQARMNHAGYTAGELGNSAVLFESGRAVLDDNHEGSGTGFPTTLTSWNLRFGAIQRGSYPSGAQVHAFRLYYGTYRLPEYVEW